MIPVKDYKKWHMWECYSKELAVEYRQSVEEGKDLERYGALFEQVAAMPDGKEKDDMADVLFRIVAKAPQRADYGFDEPNDREGIARLSERVAPPKAEPDADRVRGAWYGRICGCLLGKPVEGMKREELIPFLERSGNLPMRRYITEEDVNSHGDGFRFNVRKYPAGVLEHAPDDDDTNYIMIALRAVERYGREFTPEDMSRVWISSQGKNAYCTAERVAYRNFVNGYLPPDSALYKNPYREWIGAQIRGDFFGWISPGDPAAAADMAWRDACMSHVKNGIYGEMWIAATLAFAGAGAGIRESIEGGLSYVPHTSRFHAAVSGVLEAHRAGMSADEFFADFNRRWDDKDAHDWCHTISNAEIVTASLLWSGGDFARAICTAVEQGFDTDCNGATVGSVMGMITGYDAMPREWTDKIGGRLKTGIYGSEVVNVDEMAKKTMGFIK